MVRVRVRIRVRVRVECTYIYKCVHTSRMVEFQGL